MLSEAVLNFTEISVLADGFGGESTYSYVVSKSAIRLEKNHSVIPIPIPLPSVSHPNIHSPSLNLIISCDY